MPLPMRSVTRPKKTKGHVVASTTNNLPMPAIVYPAVTNGLRPTVSLNLPA